MNERVLIYGGAGAIGQATARSLHLRGMRCHLVGRDHAALAAAAAPIEATFTVGDVEDRGLFARASADAGGALAGLVYAVGTLQLRPLSRLEPDDALRDYRVNALGAALAVQAAAPALKAFRDTAAVVLFSSIAARQGFVSHSSIAMAKGAVEGLCVALAAELAPKVRVNAIAPSLTRTPLAAGLTSNESLANSIAGLHALQRLGEADDVARLAAFLLSSDAGWITGQVFGVDGGRSSVRTKG